MAGPRTVEWSAAVTLCEAGFATPGQPSLS